MKALDTAVPVVERVLSKAQLWLFHGSLWDADEKHHAKELHNPFVGCSKVQRNTVQWLQTLCKITSVLKRLLDSDDTYWPPDVILRWLIFFAVDHVHLVEEATGVSGLAVYQRERHKTWARDPSGQRFQKGLRSTVTTLLDCPGSHITKFHLVYSHGNRSAREYWHRSLPDASGILGWSLRKGKLEQ